MHLSIVCVRPILKDKLSCALPVWNRLSSCYAGPNEVLDEIEFQGEQAVRAMFAPDDFTLGFEVELPFAGGTIQPVSLATDPIVAALTTGFGHAIYNLNPCGVIAPHVHPRGDENVFVLEGTIDAGFIDESGALIRNAELATKTAFVIPQGAVSAVVVLQRFACSDNSDLYMS